MGLIFSGLAFSRSERVNVRTKSSVSVGIVCEFKHRERSANGRKSQKIARMEYIGRSNCNSPFTRSRLFGVYWSQSFLSIT